jgi:hypothetical protein
MDPNRDWEGEFRRDFQKLTTLNKLRVFVYVHWLYLRQEARRLYLRLCFPWLPAERVRWRW